VRNDSAIAIVSNRRGHVHQSRKAVNPVSPSDNCLVLPPTC